MSETNPPPVAPVVREYIEIGAGYVVATKGDGSTYRIHAPDDAERVIVLPEFYHPFYTQMAKAIASERAVASGELERLRAALQNIRALAAKRQHEGGPDGNSKTIEEFAIYGLEGKNP